MKKALLLTIALWGAMAMAQLPQSFMYQSVIRNNSGTVLTNQRVAAKVSILKTTASGTAVYEETHTATSDATGVLTLEIGRGTLVTGTFANIDWIADDYFLKTEIDPIGGSNYTLVTTQQLLSVPYAFVSKKTAKLVGIDSALAVLDARLNGIDSLIGVYNILIRNLNDSIQSLASSHVNPSQLQQFIQRKAKLESTINALRNSLAATRNESPDMLPRQQAIITRSAGHICDK
ncbi:MAG: hypothetical protein IKX51_06815 [Bacteroidales bacterium]|nr:hypothetical protein [Bacteroidales bacterium]